MFKFIFLSMAILCSSVTALAKTEVIKNPTAMTQSTKAEVVEFFSYTCPHCNTFEKPLNAWLAEHPEIIFKRVAVGLNKTRLPTQKLYYTLLELKADKDKYASVFKYIHDDSNYIVTDDDVMKWAALQGLDLKLFKKTYNSKVVQDNVIAADALAVQYDLKGVPSMAVNGKYMVYLDSRDTVPFFEEIEKRSRMK